MTFRFTLELQGYNQELRTDSSQNLADTPKTCNRMLKDDWVVGVNE